MLRQQSVQIRAIRRQSVLHYQAYSCRTHQDCRASWQTELRTSAKRRNNGRCATVVTTSRHPKFAFAHLLDYAMLTCKHFRNCNHFLARQRAYNVHPCSLLLRLIPSLQVSRSKGAQRNVIVGRMRAMLQALCGKSWCGFVGLGLQ